MTIKTISEPLLEFGLGQRVESPHLGLTLFGPYDLSHPSRPRSISYAVIGTAEGIANFNAFIARLQFPVVSSKAEDDSTDTQDLSGKDNLWPPFPGFEAAFSSTLPEPAKQVVILDSEINSLVMQADSHKRVYELSNIYLSGIKKLAESDDSFHAIFCVEPDAIWLNCRPESRVKNPVGIRLKKTEVKKRREYGGDLFDEFDVTQYDYSIDFRRQLKARSMQYKIPIQLLRESVLSLKDKGEDSRQLTYLSDRAWNISTALYYKAGGKPWRLSSARPGVCYIGLAFRESEEQLANVKGCCAAQMFLDTGDGVVFRGEFGPWKSERDKGYHLTPQQAEELLRGVVRTYQEYDGKALTEVFLHSRSQILRTEYEGYLKACPSGAKLVAIRVRRASDDFRLYRPGNWPVLRGTFLKLNDRSCYLWASGFKKELLTYDGWQVPVPLRIDIQHGDADIEQVATDILGLTKLNYNACRLGDGLPITVGYSDKVGEILINNPTITGRQPTFKFYI